MPGKVKGHWILAISFLFLPALPAMSLFAETPAGKAPVSGPSKGAVPEAGRAERRQDNRLGPHIDFQSPTEGGIVYRQAILPVTWAKRAAADPGVKQVQLSVREALKGNQPEDPVNIHLTDMAGKIVRTLASSYRYPADREKLTAALQAVDAKFAWVVPGNLPEGKYKVLVETADKKIAGSVAFDLRTGPDSDGDRVPDFLEEELASTFAPEVRLHPGDWTRPANVDWYLPRVKMMFEHDKDTDCEILDFGKATQGNIHQKQHRTKDWKRQHKGTQHFSNRTDKKFYLEQKDNETRKGSPSYAWVAYVHVLPSRRVPGTFAIQYWFFYPYNDAFGEINHEADWEHVTVTVDEQRNLRSIYFSQHGYGERINEPRPGGPVAFVGGTHPVVYSAKGTHASYPKAGHMEIKGSALLEAMRKSHVSNQKDVTADGGPAWQTWTSYVNVGEIGAPMKGQEFIKYGGRWGRIGKLHAAGEDVTSGPTGAGVGKMPLWEDDRQ